jgi:hypothetical protein
VPAGEAPVTTWVSAADCPQCPPELESNVAVSSGPDINSGQLRPYSFKLHGARSTNDIELAVFHIRTGAPTGWAHRRRLDYCATACECRGDSQHSVRFLGWEHSSPCRGIQLDSTYRCEHSKGQWDNTSNSHGPNGLGGGSKPLPTIATSISKPRVFCGQASRDAVSQHACVVSIFALLPT